MYGEDVDLGSDVAISTGGMQSAGLVAQSIGAGGGIAAAAVSPSSYFNGTMTLGASANAGNGSGGTVTVTTQGNVNTSGLFAPALVAQSIGGGGGLSNVLAGYNVLGGKDVGASGSVALTNSGQIGTAGAGSVGIVAQAIAGGGGLAYSAGPNARLGGAPSGSNAYGVTVSSSGAIMTTGDLGLGILAQSVSAGGGAVLGTGFAVDPSFAAGTGFAGSVVVTATAPIATGGAGAAAILAQSVGGGAVISSYAGSSGSFTADLNGGAGNNSTGGAASVTAGNTTISTLGANAPAIVAQSISNGGGYDSATNASAPSTITASFALGGIGGQFQRWHRGRDIGLERRHHDQHVRGERVWHRNAAIWTSGLASPAIVAQSIDQGGGIAAVTSAASTVFSGTVRVGATKGDNGGTAGKVNVSLSGGSIVTSGTLSPGIVPRASPAAAG